MRMRWWAVLLPVMLAAACEKNPVPEPVPREPETPEVPEKNDPVLSAAYKAVDSTRFERTAFAEWAYNIYEGGSMARLINALLQPKCKDNNEKLHLRIKEETGKDSPQWGFWDYILHYESTDALGNAVTLSERVVFPVGFGFSHRPKGLLLVNHPTIGSDAECPTRTIDYLTGMASLDYVAVFPDLQGFGVSRDRIHPYLCAEQTARNSVDGLLAVLHFLADRGYRLQDGPELRNVGYSQGGASALAVHKYLENTASEEVRAVLPLTASYCGGGPYDLEATLEVYAAQEDLAYPCVLPMILLGMKEGFPSLFTGLAPEDFFPERVVKADVLNWVRDKEHTTDEITSRIRAAANTHKLEGMLSLALQDPSSPQSQALAAAMKANRLTDGWKPVKPVWFCHVPADEVVPYVNLEKVMEGLSGGNIARLEPFVAPMQTHVGGAAGMYVMLLDGFKD